MPYLLGSIIVLVRLIKQEVGSKLLVLVARKVRLRNLLYTETQQAQTINSLALLLRDRNGMRSGREGRVLVAAGLAEQLEELVLVLGDELGELRVAGAELLQYRLEHLRLLLHDLAELLELRVLAEEVEVAEARLASLAGAGGCHGGGDVTVSSTPATASCTTASGLCGEVEQVDALVIVSADKVVVSGRLCGGFLGRCASGLLLLDVLRDALGEGRMLAPRDRNIRDNEQSFLRSEGTQRRGLG